MNKQNRNRLIENRLTDGCQRGGAFEGLGTKGEGIKNYRLVVTK